MRRALVVAAAVLGALSAGPAAAVAHPLLVQAAPTPGLVAPSAPAEIQLQFSEPTVRAGSSIQLFDGRGRRVASSRTVAGDGDRTLSIRPDARLGAAIYQVRWSALGADGHGVGGTFSFAVAGPHGPPPGAQRLVGQAGTGGSGSQSARADGAIAVVVRWLGLLAASLLAGGHALVMILRRRLGAEAGGVAARRWRRAAGPAVGALVVAAAGGVVSAVTEGAASVDLGLLTGSPTGRAELVRAILVVALVAAFALLRRTRDAALAAGAVAVLASYALAGHVLAVSGHRTLAELDQALHVVAAGLWLGGVVTLLLVVVRSPVPAGAAARAFAPLAAGALGVAVVTGVLAAIREVDRWYFLRWSDYGRVVIAKAVVVGVAALLGLATALRTRRGRDGGPRLLAAEGGLVVVALALAATLAGLAQGRGQPLPAQRGTLLPGPALATVLSDRGSAQLALAPARPGANTLSVALPGAERGARSALIKLACPCAPRPLYVALARPRGDGAWTGGALLPAAGSWYASLTVDGRTASSPVALAVGVPAAPGAAPVEVLSIADLSGPDAQRCADHVLGLMLGIGRINAAGGLDGGRKVAPLVLDDGGSAARAGALARQAIAAQHPIALAAPCGGAAGAAVAAASAAGLPSIVADPAVSPVAQAARDFRLAGDPYADGYATGQYVRGSVARAAAPGVRTVLVVDGGDAQGARRVQGVRAALSATRLRLRVVPAAAVERATKGELERWLDRRRTLTMLLDGPSPDRLAAALRRLGTGQPGFPPAPVLASSRVMSERFVQEAGGLGRLGVVQGTSEVTPDSRDALGYARAVPALYPGRHPSLDGLRGYLAGLALREGVRGGTAPASIARALLRPPPFTDALSSPWRDDAPAAGSQRFTLLAPNFLPATLIPTSAGGESYNGTFFADGAWQKLSTDLYGPPLQLPLPPL